ncbi:hypothetical protein VNI00_008752 [Paramarasmius palmivorus]|uniref:CENP-V/GFA domain-containing protein n=1 Tax=Paramarasmius palmivorus TaxID=297713 RepID=A0AAW0CVE1_9AGAR
MSLNQDSEQPTNRGGCYCGALTYSVTGKPLLAAYCHCTQCQKLTGCPFIHSIHFDPSAFQWTHIGGDAAWDVYQVKDKPAMNRYRCKTCGACVAMFHDQFKRWCIWGAQLEHVAEELKPKVHVFYDTRLLDVNDGLDKWEGIPGRSKKL